MLQLSCLSGLGTLDVVADCDADGCDGGPCLLHSELCCPNDSLDDCDAVVIGIIEDEELLKDLAIAASLSPTTAGGHRHHHKENIKSGCWGGVPSAGGTPPVHAALLDNNLCKALTTTSSSGLAAESSSPPPAAVPRPRLVVPTRKRDDRSVMSSGPRSWSLSLDVASILPTRHCSPNNRRRGNGVRQQGSVSRRGATTRSKRVQNQRACSRCDSTETTHWRSGPDGPRTLCNACGLRYTRGQCKPPPLLPEDRPSASQSGKAWSAKRGLKKAASRPCCLNRFRIGADP